MSATRSGFIAVAGRPNVGKSMLVNALVGRKIAIVSDKPQTTRRAIRGVATHGDAQLVLVDLPGVQRPRDALTQRMQARVEREVADDDGALMVLNAEEGVGPGDRWIASLLAGASVPVVIAVNKVDRLSRPQVAEALTQAAGLEVGDDIFPVSAKTGAGVAPLRAHLESLLPEGPFFFAPDAPTDQPLEVLLAELVREQVLRRTFQEVPHSVEVVIEELDLDSRDDLASVRARIWVEADSQKGILIGRGGRMIKTVGTAARAALELELGQRVHLDLRVDVRRGWRRDERLLDRLGIE
ncbi:MAG TPA: GTPase Era [Solirubrobacteraceae bacterium]|nr:GTPase Era [Solirubrobacteraceae bacterium]